MDCSPRIADCWGQSHEDRGPAPAWALALARALPHAFDAHGLEAVSGSRVIATPKAVLKPSTFIATMRRVVSSESVQAG